MGLAALGPINPHTATGSDAVAAFGGRSSVDRRGGQCARSWPDLGLRIAFATPKGADPCSGDARIGCAQLAGPAAVRAGWRTAEGIRVGMPVRAARRAHPGARPGGPGSLMLVEGPEADGSAGNRPVVLATVGGGTVTTVTFPIQSAGSCPSTPP